MSCSHHTMLKIEYCFFNAQCLKLELNWFDVLVFCELNTRSTSPTDSNSKRKLVTPIYPMVTPTDPRSTPTDPHSYSFGHYSKRSLLVIVLITFFKCNLSQRICMVRTYVQAGKVCEWSQATANSQHVLTSLSLMPSSHLVHWDQ
jgi:hypothetical protein